VSPRLGKTWDGDGERGGIKQKVGDNNWVVVVVVWWRGAEGEVAIT